MVSRCLTMRRSCAGSDARQGLWGSSGRSHQAGYPSGHARLAQAGEETRQDVRVACQGDGTIGLPGGWDRCFWSPGRVVMVTDDRAPGQSDGVGWAGFCGARFLTLPVGLALDDEFVGR